MAKPPVAWSHFNDASRNKAPLTTEQKNVIINKIIDGCNVAGLSKHDIAHVLALVEFESGFNPNAANPESSAVGLGQFIDSTGKAYLLNDENRWDVDKQISAVIDHFSYNKNIAEKNNLGEAGIYGAHHDGASGVLKPNAPGLELAIEKVLPKIEKFEKLIDEKIANGEVGTENSPSPDATNNSNLSGHWEYAADTYFEPMTGIQIGGSSPVWVGDTAVSSPRSPPGAGRGVVNPPSVSPDSAVPTQPKPPNTTQISADGTTATLPNGQVIHAQNLTVLAAHIPQPPGLQASARASNDDHTKAAA